jgi:hypothetical protein
MFELLARKRFTSKLTKKKTKRNHALVVSAKSANSSRKLPAFVA